MSYIKIATTAETTAALKEIKEAIEVIKNGVGKLSGSEEIAEKTKELENAVAKYEGNLIKFINKLHLPVKKEYALAETGTKATIKTLNEKPTNIQAMYPLTDENPYFEVLFCRAKYASVGLAFENFPKENQFGHLDKSVAITSNGNLWINGKQEKNFVYAKFEKQIIGVGIKPEIEVIKCRNKTTKKIFFTYNGCKL
uniref:Uncharacterized protein n=1 Tax=Meloidogyne javanica TaxID=6303 RepID=A0A915NAP8_MELJA